MEPHRVMAMTAREARRRDLIQQVLARKLRQRPAAELAGCSLRQLPRLVRRVHQDGARGLIHRLRGQRSHRRHPEARRQHALALYRAPEEDCGPTLACEKLAERQQPRHHQWRARQAGRGERVQVDGSHHAWLEDRGPWRVRMAYIDDATSTVFARFYDDEGPLPAFDRFAR